MGTPVAPRVYINDIRTAVPEHEVHGRFLEFVPKFLRDENQRRLFYRLERKAQIERRYSVLGRGSSDECLDSEGLYRDSIVPTTSRRMMAYEKHALPLALAALRPLLESEDPSQVTHLILSSCTGFYAPGLDLQIVQALALPWSTERTLIGFMGCNAAINALKAAHHIVRSRPESRILVVNLELCSIHLGHAQSLEQMLGFLQFADGCAASLVTSEPYGLELKGFDCRVFPEGRDLITWKIGDEGFNMHLDLAVPKRLVSSLPKVLPEILDANRKAATHLWAIHPGGRSILDAVQEAVELSDEDMKYSRTILREYGNMSSPTIMFVLELILRDIQVRGPGYAMAFGPGLVLEALRFEKRPQ